MKKRKSNGKWKPAFWLVFVIGVLWITFIPPRHHAPVSTITVKVQPVPEPQPKPPVPAEVLSEPSSGGEEKTPQQGASNGENVTIPVVPEKPTTITPGAHPKIAIVIDDVGLDIKGSERAIKLPPFITLSFLPYATRLREQTKEAHDEGHELLLHMPMEPVGHEDPGPGALLVDLPMRDLQQRFETALASFTGFDGVNNHMGSKFTAYSDGMTMVVDELQQRHLFYLDSRTSAQSVGFKIAQEKGLPTIGRDVFLDDVQSTDTIRAQLEQTEHLASRKGYAIAIGHPHTVTLDVLESWIPDAQKRRYEFVPVGSLVKAQ
jgi:polysaccharide deacetylase 2 family uncharacterized protein YibQ